MISNQFSFSDEELSSKSTNYELAMRNVSQTISQDFSNLKPSVSNVSISSSESDIYTLYNASKTNQIEDQSPRLVRRRIPHACRPKGYTRHSNLDVRPLSFKEQFNLSRRYYLTIANIIWFCTVLFCLGWFIYIAQIICKEYEEHDTIIYLEYKNPNASKPPAISICTHEVLDS